MSGVGASVSIGQPGQLVRKGSWMWNAEEQGQTGTCEDKLKLDVRGDLWGRLALSATELQACLAQDLEQLKEEIQRDLEELRAWVLPTPTRWASRSAAVHVSCCRAWHPAPTLRAGKWRLLHFHLMQISPVLLPNSDPYRGGNSGKSSSRPHYRRKSGKNSYDFYLKKIFYWSIFYMNWNTEIFFFFFGTPWHAGS